MAVGLLTVGVGLAILGDEWAARLGTVDPLPVWRDWALRQAWPIHQVAMAWGAVALPGVAGLLTGLMAGWFIGRTPARQGPTAFPVSWARCLLAGPHALQAIVGQMLLALLYPDATPSGGAWTWSVLHASSLPAGTALGLWIIRALRSATRAASHRVRDD